MSFQLPSIYPLTDVVMSRMSHAEQVSKLIEGGATLIQLREKTLSPRDFYEQAKPALDLAKSLGVKILINDRVDLAMSLKADGVHLGQDDLSPMQARELLGADAIIGFSTHSVQQARQALTLPIDYLAIGPIFSTDTKGDTAPEVGLDGLTAVKAVAGGVPLVAIGGIGQEQIPDVLRAGADSIALISAVFRDPTRIDASFARLSSAAKQF